MIKFTPSIRTSRDIRTIAHKSRAPRTAQLVQEQLFTLRTEYHHRGLERSAAVRRIANIDLRCTQIEQESRDMLQLLNTLSRAQRRSQRNDRRG